ncbi:MAG: aminopeptidase [Stappiaceae bacterium]
MNGRLLYLSLALGLLLMLQGCGNVSYLSQSVGGHLKLVSGSKRVETLLKDQSIDPAFKQQLDLSREIRQFAIENLDLPDNESYRKYVDTGREYVTWSVFAAPELALDVRTWCFPVAGCVPYRGYFSKAKAEKFAEKIKAEGLDVHLGGVPAYSTLGWLDDPLLNTMFLRGEINLARVVFHELAHQRVYVPGDSAFNEAFAVAVEESGTIAWLKSRSDTAGLHRYRAAQKRNETFLALIADSRKELRRIYDSDASEEQKRAAKTVVIEKLRARYSRVKSRQWNGYSGYDRWFSQPINNAKLATVSVYNDLQPAFSRLLEACDGDYERFYQSVGRIGKLDMAQRRAALQNISGCG